MSILQSILNDLDLILSELAHDTLCCTIINFLL
jgi:hypothetical protein